MGNIKLALVAVICICIGGIGYYVSVSEAQEVEIVSDTGTLYFGRAIHIDGGWAISDDFKGMWAKEGYITVFAGYTKKGYTVDVEIIEGQEYYFLYTADFRIKEVHEDRIVIELIK